MNARQLVKMGFVVAAAFCSAVGVGYAGEKPAEPAAKIERLLQEIAPADGPVRPPFDLARHDLGLAPQPGVERTLEGLRLAARERQERLLRFWAELKPALAAIGAAGPKEAADAAFLAYAFGEEPFEPALAAARRAGAAERLRLARLLLADCRFDEAVAELAALAAGRDAVALAALAELARHAEERKALEKEVRLVPLAFDLEGFLAKRSRDKETGALIAALRRASEPRVRPGLGQVMADQDNAATAEDPFVIDHAMLPVESPISSFMNPRDIIGDSFKSWQVDPKTLDRTWLETASVDLVLYRERSEIVSGGEARLKLWSAYCGPMRFNLYRFKDRADWEKVTPAELARTAPAKSWEQTFRPLAENNAEARPRDCDVSAPVPEEGYYLLTCAARYAPQLAVQKFCVSHAALYIRAGRNQTVVAAIDRRSGRPLAGEPVELEISGRPETGRIVERLKPELPEAFGAGLEGRESAAPPEPGAQNTQHLLAWSRAYVEGRKLSERYPKTAKKLAARTGPDGAVAFPVDLNGRDYSYTLDARRPGAGLAEVRVYYSEPPEPEDTAKAVVWCDQPIYRPGSTVHFKGMVRRFNGLRVAPHDAGWKSAVDVEVRSEKDEVLWKGECQLSAAGSFGGDLRLPLSAALGGYRFRVDGREAGPSVPFTVEEFRLPTFWCNLSLDRRAYRGGEKAVGTVSVRYFSGKPADGAVVELVLETGEENPPTRTVITDAEGRASFEFTVPLAPKELSLPLRATVADPGGQSRTSTDYLNLTGVPFELQAEVEPRPAVRGTAIDIQVSARDWSRHCNPVAGATVTVAGCGQAAITDAGGHATIRTMAAANGERQEFSVSASLGGEAVHTSCSVGLQAPVAGADLPQDRPAHRDYLEAHAYDCNSGQPLHVKLEVDNALDRETTVLLFVENTRLLAFRSLALKPGKHELSIPTDLDFAPNVSISALAYNGRERSLASRSSARVFPSPRFLKLEVTTDKEQYRPGERCVAELRALDWQGRPVAGAEISLGVIHEGIYSLRGDPTPDLQDFYWGSWLPTWPRGEYDCPAPYCPPIVWLRGPKYAWGHMVHGGVFGYRDGGGRRKAVGRWGGSMASEGLAELPRRDFRTSAHWVADLVTGKDGRARTEFVFPDYITEWRFTARGLTADTKVGQVRVKRGTMLPLQVELSVPRAIRGGDRVVTAALVHNNRGPERKVALEFSAAERSGRAELAVPAGLTRRADVLIDRPEAGTIKLAARVRDLGGEGGDAVELSAPVAPRGYPASRGFSGLVRDGGVVPLDLGGELAPGSLRVSVAVEPGLAGPIESALDGLIGYPYGCVEQTMSRFMPAAVAARAMKAAGLASPREKELPGIFDQGLARLSGFQHEDGGWGWWKDDATTDFMTAYVLEGLALCRASGHPVPAGMLERAEKHLSARLIEDKLGGQNVGAVGDVDIRIWTAHALGVCYTLEPERHADAARAALAALARVRPSDGQAWSARDAALRADALRLLGDGPAAEAALKELADGFAVARGDRRSILAAATLLELGAALSPADGRWAMLARRLVEARRGGGWGDTLVSAAAVRGLAAMLSAAPGECGPVEMLVDGRVVATLTPGKSTRAIGELRTELAGARELKLRAKQPGSAGFWSARVEGCLVRPPAPPANPEVRLTCRYFRLVPERAEIPVGPDGRLAVAPGTTVEVRLECELARPLSYLRLSFPRPCGVELVRQPDFAKAKLVAFEERDDGLHCFADAWEAGRHEVSFLVRPECAGEVFAPPPEIEPMYGDAVPVSVTAATTWAMERAPSE